MSFFVNSGTRIQCSFGTAPGTLRVLPTRNVSIDGAQMANILDNKPMVNIQPCGLCRSLANPVVASATSAAMGVLTPMPCVPNTTAPWMPGKTDVLINNQPALLGTDKLLCAWGGIIQINE